MSRELLAACLVGGFVSFMFAACGGADEDPCVSSCPNWAGSVITCNLPFQTTVICGVDQQDAIDSCFGMDGVSWLPATLCDPAEGETGDNPGDDAGNDPWSPVRSITFDSDSGEYIIDQLAFEELKLDPAPLFTETSKVEQLESGHFQVTTIGELADALGWRRGDILHSVNNYELEDSADFAAAFVDLADQSRFELVIEREQRKVVLRYRVE